MKETLTNLTASSLATLATAVQGQTILDTDTLLPAGLWVGGIVIVWRASWRVSEAVQRFVSRMDGLEQRVSRIERRCVTVHKMDLAQTQKLEIDI